MSCRRRTDGSCGCPPVDDVAEKQEPVDQVVQARAYPRPLYASCWPDDAARAFREAAEKADVAGQVACVQVTLWIRTAGTDPDAVTSPPKKENQ